LIGGYRALGAHHFNRSQAANLDLLFRVRKRLLRKGERLVLHPHIFVGKYQIPVNVLDLVNRGDDLQSKRDIGDFTVVLGDADQTIVRQKSKALQ